MKLWNNRRKSARAIIIIDDKLLVFHRKRFSKITGQWIEYYSIPGGGIDRGETPEQAVVRELKEEMGVVIEPIQLIAKSVSKNHEHYTFIARIVSGEPCLMLDSEEAEHMHEGNQYEAVWVDIKDLTTKNLRYYGNYLELIRELANDNIPERVRHLDAR